MILSKSGRQYWQFEVIFFLRLIICGHDCVVLFLLNKKQTKTNSKKKNRKKCETHHKMSLRPPRICLQRQKVKEKIY